MTRPTRIEAGRRYASHYQGILERLGEAGDEMGHALAREWPQIRQAASGPPRTRRPPRARSSTAASRGWRRTRSSSRCRARVPGAKTRTDARRTSPPDAGGDPRLARSLLEWTLALARQDGDRREEGVACSAIGTIHLRLGEDGLAEEYFSRAREIARTLRDPEGIGANGEGAAPPARTEQRKATVDPLQRAPEASDDAGRG